VFICTICLFVLLGTILVLVADVALVRSLIVNRAPWPWWMALAVILLVGLVLGWWCGFRLEYQISEHKRGYGAPFSSGTAVFEDGKHVRTDEPPLPGFIMLFDTLFVALASVVPLSVVYYIWGRRTRAGVSSATGPPPVSVDK
jgi:Na+/melibiose symporter-like transporter